jgi:16S rRNA C967 or C1407 C5-methylase (RsmB/RsmF family)/NOL1/NOP2/fmu family ribosome biogenesis protein
MQIPSSLLASLQSVDGYNENLFLAAHQTPSITSIRLNVKKNITAFDDAPKVPWATDAYYLTQRPFFAHDPLWHAGAYYVQEASSMFLQHALTQIIDTTATLKILDLCAAPGGKSTLVADVISNDSLLVCNEVIGTRVNILAENICKWGRANTWVSNSDAKQIGQCKNYFDVILVDAPCSGSGLFRKDENAINEWSEGNVQLCAERQERILHDILPALKPNGVLIYMTCSYSPAENEKVVDKLLQQTTLTSVQIPIQADWNIIETQSETMQGFGYRFYPHLLQGEGFFCACFINNAEEVLAKDLKYYKPSKTNFSAVETFIDTSNKTIITENDNVFAMPTNAMDDYLYLNKNIKLVRKGTLLGKIMQGQLIPEHDLALSVDCHYASKVEVDLQAAQHYLLKESFALPDCLKGWQLLTYQQIPIGWIKNLGNRFNNYYPTNWRIKTRPKELG